MLSNTFFLESKIDKKNAKVHKVGVELEQGKFLRSKTTSFNSRVVNIFLKLCLC